MRAQLSALQEALAGGMPRRGWKVGINVPEILTMLRLRHSGVGWLNGHNLYRSGETIIRTVGHGLHVEPELCLLVRSRIAPEMSSREALSSLHAAAPAFELVDYSKRNSDLDSIVAQSMFHAGLVVGSWQPVELASQLGRRRPVVWAADQTPLQPRPDLVPNDLGKLLVFVAEFLQAFGHTLEPGDLVLTGSYLATAVPLPPGATAKADFGLLGSVEISVAA
jgi:2-oxo-hept-3-ene-1,7-dioate hydratase